MPAKNAEDEVAKVAKEEEDARNQMEDELCVQLARETGKRGPYRSDVEGWKEGWRTTYAGSMPSLQRSLASPRRRPRPLQRWRRPMTLSLRPLQPSARAPPVETGGSSAGITPTKKKPKPSPKAKEPPRSAPIRTTSTRRSGDKELFQLPAAPAPGEMRSAKDLKPIAQRTGMMTAFARVQKKDYL